MTGIRAFLVITVLLSLSFGHVDPLVPSRDGSERIIPVTISTDQGVVHDNHPAQLCGTSAPTNNFKTRLEGLQSSRRAEKRGLSRMESGLHGLGLESIYEVVDADHEDWEIGENIDDESFESNPRKLVRRGKSNTPSPQIVVETYFHFVSSKDQSKYYTAKRRNQIANNQAIALNKAYQPVGVTFHVHPHSYTIRDDWANDQQSTNMKKALRQGDYADLNLYFQTNLTSGGSQRTTLLGYCTFPTDITYTWNGQEYEYPQSNWVADGCNVLAASLPGSPVAVYGYDEGKTAVHEVGHWFGLLHTFQDGTCQPGAKGDLVDDTPQELIPTVGCPKGKDSCKDLPGLDPISNYMDYSDDQCYTTFTPEQITRMRDLFKNLREGH